MRMRDVRQTAREKMKGACRVCPQCNGKACAGEFPGMGGIGNGSAFTRNVTALSGIKLKMRLLHDVRMPDTSTNLLGIPLALPVLAAPIGGTAYNMGGAITEGQYADAIVAGCLAGGIYGCTGDALPNDVFDEGIRALREQNGRGIPFIKPWADEAVFNDKLEHAVATGCQIIGVDIDMAATRARGGHPFTNMTFAELAALVKKIHAHGVKFILKGLMCPEDAVIAEDCGCDAIVVSNHGGRIFEAAEATADVLPAVAACAHRIPVLVDGGVRSGADVLKMLALGADAVLVGRPFIIAATGGEAEGVRTYAARLQDELREAMTLTGCASVHDAGSALLARS